MLLDQTRASLLLVDMQERLLSAMHGGDEALQHCILLVRMARTLGLPLALSEQYPKGLGPTVAALKAEVGNAPTFEKLAFSCAKDPVLRAHLDGLREAGREQIVVAGIEAHVCVLQTAVDLAAAGWSVYAAVDAMASRAPLSLSLAVERLRQANVQAIDTEMAVFELLGAAGTPEFKSLSVLVR